MAMVDRSMAKGKPGRPTGSIVDPATRRSRGNLAALFRDRFHEEVIFDWFLHILMGKNPKIVQDARYERTGGLHVVEDTDDPRTPSPERRDAAMRHLLDRRDGLPAQRVQLEAELRTLQVTGQLSAQDLAALPPAALGRIADALRGAFAASGAPAALPAGEDQDDEEVLEAMATESDQPSA